MSLITYVLQVPCKSSTNKPRLFKQKYKVTLGPDIGFVCIADIKYMHTLSNNMLIISNSFSDAQFRILCVENGNIPLHIKSKCSTSTFKTAGKPKG